MIFYFINYLMHYSSHKDIIELITWYIPFNFCPICKFYMFLSINFESNWIKPGFSNKTTISIHFVKIIGSFKQEMCYRGSMFSLLDIYLSSILSLCLESLTKDGIKRFFKHMSWVEISNRWSYSKYHSFNGILTECSRINK